MSGAVPSDAAGPTLLAVTQAVVVFTNFLPPLSEVRRGDLADTEFVADVRMGEVGASLLTIGVGAAVSGIIGTAIPFAISILAAVMLVCLYEFTLRGKPFSVPQTRAATPQKG